MFGWSLWNQTLLLLNWCAKNFFFLAIKDANSVKDEGDILKVTWLEMGFVFIKLLWFNDKSAILWQIFVYLGINFGLESLFNCKIRFHSNLNNLLLQSGLGSSVKIFTHLRWQKFFNNLQFLPIWLLKYLKLLHKLYLIDWRIKNRWKLLLASWIYRLTIESQVFRRLNRFIAVKPWNDRSLSISTVKYKLWLFAKLGAFLIFMLSVFILSDFWELLLLKLLVWELIIVDNCELQVLRRLFEHYFHNLWMLLGRRRLWFLRFFTWPFNDNFGRFINVFFLLERLLWLLAHVLWFSFWNLLWRRILIDLFKFYFYIFRRACN